MKKKNIPLVAVFSTIALPISFIACDNDDDINTNDTNKNVTDETNKSSSLFKYVITSTGEVGVAGFSETYNGDTINPLDYESITIPKETVIEGKTYMVTSIGRKAFMGSKNLTSISIPESVTQFGDSAFFNCEKLKFQASNNIILGKAALHNCGNIYTGKIGDKTFIDLGLPSGTKWATFNIGATKPTEYGDYFAWGETMPKTDYSWDTYKWCENKNTDNLGYPRDMIKYCTKSEFGTVDNILLLVSDDDVATANWGSQWATPNLEEVRELIDNCTWEWTNNYHFSRIPGCIGTSKSNGLSIFIPAAGYYNEKSELLAVGEEGYYWTSSLAKSVLTMTAGAHKFFYTDDFSYDSFTFYTSQKATTSMHGNPNESWTTQHKRCCGQPVRAIIKTE